MSLIAIHQQLSEINEARASLAMSSPQLLWEVTALRIRDRDCQLRRSAPTEKYERRTLSLGVTELGVCNDRVLAVPQQQRIQLVNILFQRRRKCVLTFRPLDKQKAARRLAASCKDDTDRDLTCECASLQLNVCIQQLVTPTYANVSCPQQVRRISQERAGIRKICVETVVRVENEKVFPGATWSNSNHFFEAQLRIWRYRSCIAPQAKREGYLSWMSLYFARPNLGWAHA